MGGAVVVDPGQGIGRQAIKGVVSIGNLKTIKPKTN